MFGTIEEMASLRKLTSKKRIKLHAIEEEFHRPKKTVKSNSVSIVFKNDIDISYLCKIILIFEATRARFGHYQGENLNYP